MKFSEGVVLNVILHKGYSSPYLFPYTLYGKFIAFPKKKRGGGVSTAPGPYIFMYCQRRIECLLMSYSLFFTSPFTLITSIDIYQNQQFLSREEDLKKSPGKTQTPWSIHTQTSPSVSVPLVCAGPIDVGLTCDVWGDGGNN